MMTTYHNPVLLNESVDGLNINPGGIYVDVTFGGGGHSKEILSRLNEKGKLLAFDQDKDAEQNTLNDERFTLIRQNFRFIKRYLKFYGIQKVDGVLADLGVSSHQFDSEERGFSTRFDGELDMRMDQAGTLSGYKVINQYEEEKLSEILFMYGELRNARAIAKKIVTARETQPIKTSFELKKIVSEFVPKAKEHKVLAQIFQAVRIEVNSEMEALKEFLLQLPEIVNTSGRISIISYHSLEDRLVKRFIQNGCFEGEPEKDFFGNTKVPFKKVGGLITPGLQEIKNNNRARSAKLRIATKV